MEVSKLTIDKELIKFKPIPKKAKVKLRKQRIIELIQSKPYMARITGAELAEAAQLSPGNAWAMVQRMAKKGEVKHNLTPRTYAYTLQGDTKVVRPALANHQPEIAPEAPILVKNHQLAEYAKQFSWEYNSDSLRDFVRYMDGRELELRRGADVR